MTLLPTVKVCRGKSREDGMTTTEGQGTTNRMILMILWMQIFSERWPIDPGGFS